MDEKKIVKVLQDELTLQLAHRRLLSAQEKALIQCNRPRFCELQAEYVKLVADLERQQTMRESLLVDRLGMPCTFGDISAQLSDRARPIFDRLRTELAKTIQSIRQMTERNQRLIQNELDYITFTLDLFVDIGRNTSNKYYGFASTGGRMLLDRRA